MKHWLRSLSIFVPRNELSDADIDLMAAVYRRDISYQILEGSFVRAINSLNRTSGIVELLQKTIEEPIEVHEAETALQQLEQEKAYMATPHSSIIPLGVPYTQRDIDRLRIQLLKQLSESYEVHQLEIYESNGQNWLRFVLTPTAE